MVTYLVRRILIGLFTLVLITFVVFALIRNIPGTPLTLDFAESDPSRQISKADMDRLLVHYGLDKPWPVAYVQWLTKAVSLDFGRSFREQRPVSRVIGERIGPTLLLSGISIFLVYSLSVPLGLYCTVRSGKRDERIISVVLYMLYSFPAFVAALFLLSVFYAGLKDTPFQLPGGGMVSDNYADLSFGEKVLDWFRHLVLPVTCYTYLGLAYYTRFIYSNMQEVVRQDYIRTARAKGVSARRVITVHAFRNTLIPFVTQIGLSLAGLLSGSVILEQIFTWPGMGRLFFESVDRRDYPVIMGMVLLFGILTLLGQLLADILYAWADPRVNYS